MDGVRKKKSQKKEEFDAKVLAAELLTDIETKHRGSD